MQTFAIKIKIWKRNKNKRTTNNLNPSRIFRFPMNAKYFSSIAVYIQNTFSVKRT